MTGSKDGFFIGDWYVDIDANLLRKDNREIRLENRVMAVLAYLAQRPGQPVMREEIEQAVWGQAVVGYDALTRCIARLRKELGDDPKQPVYIETIPKKGYRLIAPVSNTLPDVDRERMDEAKQAASGIDPTGLLGWIALLTVLILVLVAGLLLWPYEEPTVLPTSDTSPAPDLSRPSLAVLPFKSLSDDSGQQYFVDGISADITTALSKLSNLTVITHASALSLSTRHADTPSIADALGVRYLLSGSARLNDDQLRVNVQLIDRHNNVIWAESYDRKLQNLFEVQDDITASIVDALSIALTEEEKQRQAKRYTVDLAAYDDFLHGQSYYIRFTKEDNETARTYYQNAILRDASFARAFSALALTYIIEHRRGWGGSPSASLAQALEYAQKAVAINNELPQAWWALSYVHMFRQDFSHSVEAANRVIALNPNFADAYLTLAISKIHAGSPTQAITLVRKAILLNPAYPAAYASVLGQAYFFMDDFEQAIPVLRDAVERNLNLLIPHVFLTVALAKLNRMEEAKWAAEQIKMIAPDFQASHIDEMLPIQDESVISNMKQYLSQAGL